jgi:hypothetical protein
MVATPWRIFVKQLIIRFLYTFECDEYPLRLHIVVFKEVAANHVNKDRKQYPHSCAIDNNDYISNEEEQEH